MPTDQYIYQNKEMRDLAWETEKARGSKGVTRFTDQIDGKLVYILAVPHQVGHVTKSNEAADIPDFALNAQKDLTTNENGDNMTSEGSPNV
jgi:hypothetical protein